VRKLKFTTFEQLTSWKSGNASRNSDARGRRTTTNWCVCLLHLRPRREPDSNLHKKFNTVHTVMSGASKLGALCATCPYQDIHSLIEVRPPRPPPATHPRANFLNHTFTHSVSNGRRKPALNINTFF
jgi:hypothetical protein